MSERARRRVVEVEPAQDVADVGLRRQLREGGRTLGRIAARGELRDQAARDGTLT
jgi:hypothetical protein